MLLMYGCGACFVVIAVDMATAVMLRFFLLAAAVLLSVLAFRFARRPSRRPQLAAARVLRLPSLARPASR